MKNAALRAKLGADPFALEILEGLSRPQKTIAPKWLYDAEGSRLFDEITRLPEYYVTRTETALIAARMAEIAAFVGPHAVVVEYGAGGGHKAEMLLAGLVRPSLYRALEIEPGAARAAAAKVAALGVPAEAVVADFTALRAAPPAPAAPRGGARVGFFPGSTIGNFDPDEAIGVLRGFRAHLGAGAKLILGVDRVKPLDVLLPAYDDAAGVTAAFNLNLLARLNRELSATFVLDAFAHEARWNAEESRIEMHLVSRALQRVGVAGACFAFAAGESIHTENSYKYDDARLSALAASSGWRIARHWRDPRDWFSLLALEGL